MIRCNARIYTAKLESNALQKHHIIPTGEITFFAVCKPCMQCWQNNVPKWQNQTISNQIVFLLRTNNVSMPCRNRIRNVAVFVVFSFDWKKKLRIVFVQRLTCLSCYRCGPTGAAAAATTAAAAAATAQQMKKKSTNLNVQSFSSLFSLASFTLLFSPSLSLSL